MKDLEPLDAAFVIDTFLLLLIGIGPKIALVPFLEATAAMPEAVKRRVLRKMLTTAAIVAVLLLVLGGLLTRLLHFSPGALGVASGIILLVIAVAMVLGHQNGNGGDHPVEGRDPGKPITASQLGERLRALGIYAMPGRRAALTDLAAKMPSAVLADLLHLSPGTAVRWVHQAGGDWSRYAAELARERVHQT